MVQLESYKRELTFIFFMQKKKILLTILLMTLISVMVSFLYPPIYTAQGSLLVKSKKITGDPEALEKAQLRSQPVDSQDLYSEMAILSSSEVMRKAIDSLEELEEDEVFTALMDQLGIEHEERYLELYKLFTAHVVPDSNVLAVQLQADSPLNAQKLLEAIMNQYIRYRTEIYDPKNMILYFNKQINRYHDDATQKREEIRALVEAGGVTQASTQIEHNLEIHKDLVNSITKLQSEAVSERLEMESLRKWLANPDQVQFFSYIDNDGILALSSRFQELFAEQRDVQGRYLEGSEVAIRSQERVDQAYNALRNEILSYVGGKKTSLQIIERKIEVFSRQIEIIEQNNIDLRNKQLEIDQLEKDLDIIRTSYDIFFQRSQESIASENSLAANLNSYVSYTVARPGGPGSHISKAQIADTLGSCNGPDSRPHTWLPFRIFRSYFQAPGRGGRNDGYTSCTFHYGQWFRVKLVYGLILCRKIAMVKIKTRPIRFFSGEAIF